MNFREGTRRLALLLGVAGAISCGVLSFVQLQTNLSQRAEHQRFERLTKSPIVKQARQYCFGPPHYTIGPPPLPKGAEPIPPFCFIPVDDPNALSYTPSHSNSDAIKEVHFENRQIASIETQDG